MSDKMTETIMGMAQRLVALEGRVAQLEAERRTTKAAPAVPVADDAELDGKYGDPIVRYGLKPKYWPHQPDEFVGKKLSQCAPAYLDATAKYFEACAFMARKDGDEKKAGYKDRDAARARGHAARLRAGWKPPPEPEAPAFGGGGFGDAPSFGDDAGGFGAADAQVPADEGDIQW